MQNALILPLSLIKFWYIDTPLEMLAIFSSFNGYFMKLFALPLSITTFFKPLKNEYRQGLVGFSRALGILVKSCLITVDIFLFSLIILIEILILLFFLLFPVFTFLLLFF